MPLRHFSYVGQQQRRSVQTGSVNGIHAFWPKLDNHIGRLGLVRRKARPLRIIPAGQLHHFAGRNTVCVIGYGWLHDVEPVPSRKKV